MRRIRLHVAYDGTNYCGWQTQKNGMSIEEVLDETLSEITGEDVRVQGASRTDAGVHALDNIAVFDTGCRIPAEKICYAVNPHLPCDIKVLSSEEVPAAYHPRKCNTIKTYEYNILNRTFPDPLRRFTTCFCYQPLDEGKMKAAAGYIEGEHDFSSFCSSGSSAEDKIRRIYEADVKRDEDIITIRLAGDGFLYNMVRIIAGTLMDAGRGMWEPEYMRDILNERDRKCAGRKAPAEGLTLVSVKDAGRLPERERLANDWIDYTIDRTQLDEGKVTMIIHSCRESERERMKERTAMHAFRDGADELLVFDEAGETGSPEIIKKTLTHPNGYNII